MKHNEEKKWKVLMWVVTAVIFCVMFMAIAWAVWLLWTWVLPQIWPSGPVGFINPGYWLFLGGWVLAITIFKMLTRG